MFRRRSSQRTSNKILPPSTIFPHMSCSFSPRVRILILYLSVIFFDNTAPTGIHSEPPTSHEAPSDPQGQVPNPFSYPLSKVNPKKLSGGTAKIVDSTTFKVSTRIAVADVTVEPGAIRELHVSVRVLFGYRSGAYLDNGAHSGTRHKTSGFTFCNDTLSYCLGLTFGADTGYSGRAMAA